MENNKKKKLSPLQELRERKKTLKIECKQDESRLFNVVDNVRTNWKSLLLGSIFPSTKKKSRSIFSFKKKNDNESAESSFLLKLVPLAWAFLQPILTKAIMKRIEDMFSGKKK